MIVSNRLRNSLYSLIFEFYGDYWHGNPSKYNSNEINRSVNTTMNNLYLKTMKRQKEIELLGYEVCIIWEDQWIKIYNLICT